MALLLHRGKSAQLGHRAYYRGTAARRNPWFVVGARDGRISWCDFGGEPRIASVQAPGKIRSLSLHPTSGLVAVIDEETGDLLLLAEDGAVTRRLVAPETYVPASEWVERGYNDCWFDPDGERWLGLSEQVPGSG